MSVTYRKSAITITMKNVKQRPSGLFIYRKGIPKDLRQYYDGKLELVHSLKTRSASEAAIKAEAYESKYQAEFDNYRAGVIPRELAVTELQKYYLDPVPIHQQDDKQDNLSELLEDYSYIASHAGEYDNRRLNPVQQKALEIIQGEEKPKLSVILEHALSIESDRKKRSHLTCRFNYFLGNGCPDDLHKIRVKTLNTIKRTLSDKYANDTVKKAIRTVKNTVNNYLIEHEITAPNPFEKVSLTDLKKDTVKRHAFSISELHKLRSEILKDPTANRSVTFAGLLYDTGCRPNEIGAARLSDIDLDHEIPHIKVIDNEARSLKTAASERLVPLTGVSLKTAQKLLQESSSDQEYIFPSFYRNGDYKNDSATAAIRKWIKVRVPEGVTYSFRHAMRDRLIDAGNPQLEVESLMGWSRSGMIHYYGTSQALHRLSEALELLHQHEVSKAS